MVMVTQDYIFADKDDPMLQQKCQLTYDDEFIIKDRQIYRDVKVNGEFYEMQVLNSPDASDILNKSFALILRPKNDQEKIIIQVIKNSVSE
jgi:hypothetical protein